MKKQEIMDNCIKQMIFEDFLLVYADLIKKLLCDQSFLSIIDYIQNGVPEEIEFCANNETPAFKNFKDCIGQALFESQAYPRCVAYSYIVDSVKEKGVANRGMPYATKSAAISVYYAIRYYQIAKSSRV